MGIILLLAAVFPLNVPPGHPVALETPLDSPAAQVLYSGRPLPAKIDFRGPHSRLFFLSQGPGNYTVQPGPPTPEPALIGAGDRVTYGRPHVRARLGVGLYAHPGALDMDADGDLDLILTCPDRPFNGIFLATNLGSNTQPLFSRPLWLGPAVKDPVVADANGDGHLDLVYSGGYFSHLAQNRLSQPVPLSLPRTYHVGRDDLWYPIDWDRDGKIDILNGVSDWRDYGWDDAFNEQGQWTRGPLHGYVYFWRNEGSNQSPRFLTPVQLPIDQYGTPAPNPIDWDNDGHLDLVLANFLDQVFLLKHGESKPVPFPFQMELQMIQPRALRWLPVGPPSLLIGEEGGYVALAHNGQNPQYLEQIDPFLKSGSLARPVAADWNQDGKLDLLIGNSAGEIQFFENTGTQKVPAFTARGNLIPPRRAGPNGSIQGPAEAKWGYANPSVADWDLDGLPDLLVNDIWGDVVWYRNLGQGKLAPRQSVEVDWPAAPPKPSWVWWQPHPKQLVSQWRTTPKVVDWNRDGLPDLVMLDHRGYLCLYPRQKVNGILTLEPPQRLFVEPNGRFLQLARNNYGASGRRKVELADWDSDGDLDLITDSDDGPIWYENEGSHAKPVMRLRGLLIKAKLNGHNPTPNAADWNGDGLLDILVGAEDGHLYYFDRRFINSR
ncbi:MAG: VCBS repeat-containing protein [Acidobacteria bacterium]|nr:VCBS repeat-containing protein [Bryobacteraceae bacterium CoA2 C42]